MVQPEWERALAGFQVKILELNKRIFDYNLEAPTEQFKRSTLNVDHEITRITGAAD